MYNKYGVSQEAYNDHRFSDIGDLPTGFGPYKSLGVSKIYCRPFAVRELSLLYMGSRVQYNGIDHIIRAVDMAISCDVNILTDGDFEYVMMWLRMNSYPKAPSLVRWECRKLNVVEARGRAFYEGDDIYELTERDMKLKGLELEVCNTENNEIVHSAETLVHTFEDDDIEMVYDDLDFPRVGTLREFAEIVSEQPELEYQARLSRWIKEGETIEDKMRILNSQDTFDLYKRILECETRYMHGISEKLNLKCRTCDNKVQHTARPDPLTFFADNSEKDILDIQYTLLSELKLPPDDNMPAKTLLYHHSCLAKDKQAEEERNRMRRSVRGT